MITDGHVLQIERPQALPFDHVRAKVRVPNPRPGSIPRTGLVNRLRGAGAFPLVSLVAPAGYGKTTVLAQWAERDQRPFAWVSLDDRDNDAIVLLRHVAAALDSIAPLDPPVVKALKAPGRSIWTTAVPRLTGSLSAFESPCVLVLDDASQLQSEASIEVVEAIARHMPDRSTLALAGRTALAPIATLRPEGSLLEIGPELLALTRREAERLVSAMGVRLNDDVADDLFDRTEGWAAGLYLAVLALRDPSAGNPSEIDLIGGDRFLADYFHLEYLSALQPDELAFLRRIAILDEMSGPICDAVLAESGSAFKLESIERANMFLIPIDRRREAYRYHCLFRDLLRSELERYEPELVPGLHARAAAWFGSQREPEAAIAHARLAGDLDRVARLVAEFGLATYDAGRPELVEAWLEGFTRDQMERHPEVALLGSWINVLRSRAVEAARLLVTAEASIDRGSHAASSVDARPWVALVSAALCGAGAEQMAVDAEAALDAFEADSRLRPTARLLHGAALALIGEHADASTVLDEAIAESEIHQTPFEAVAAMGERTLIALELDDHETAGRLVARIRELVAAIGDGTMASGALGLAVSARALLRRGRLTEAHRELVEAGRPALRPPETIPWLAVRTRVELARAHVSLRGAAAARDQLTAARTVLAQNPGLGVLRKQIELLDAEIDLLLGQDGRELGLTSAELRVLPLLTTHLSFREIASRLYVSRNTVKTQAISIYRKLGASTRSEAIEKAERLGLLDARLSA